MSEEYLQQKELETQRTEDVRHQLKVQARVILKNKMDRSGITEALQSVELSRVTMLARFILILSVIADLIGVIPFVGTIFSYFFIVLFIVLYFINGLGKGAIKGGIKKRIRKNATKFLVKALFFTAEGVPILTIVPWFTVAALVDILISQKSFKEAVKKLEEIKNKLK